MIDVVPAHTDEMIEPVRLLLAELADSLGVDVGSGPFVGELLALPGDWDHPRGRLVVALEAAHLAGCGALRDAGGGSCFVERLYVREEYRDRGVEGRLLAHLLGQARRIGYSTVLADLGQSMKSAGALLSEAGFVATDAPGTGVLRMEL